MDGDIVSPELIATGNYTVEAANADTVDTKHDEEAAAVSSELIATRNSTTEAATKKEEGDDDVSSELITAKNSTVKAASSVTDNMETIKENEVAAAVSSGLITTWKLYGESGEHCHSRHGGNQRGRGGSSCLICI